ncbi:NAD(P)H-binding protein, partial [Sphingomonas sp. GC_Shp_2]
MSNLPLIVMAGASGDLGGRIARALISRGVPTRALVRTNTRQAQLPTGLEVVPVDFADHDRLRAACDDATCIVSAVNGLGDVVLDLQSRLLDAAIAASVPRFIPSDYSLDFTRTAPGRNRNLDLRRAFKAKLDAAPIAATSVLNGAFADLLAGQAPIVLHGIRRILYWGEADQHYDFTTK